MSRHLRTVCRIRFKAPSLAPGRKLVKSLPSLLSAFLGLNIKPRKVKLTCRCCSVRLLSLQYTIFDFRMHRQPAVR